MYILSHTAIVFLQVLFYSQLPDGNMDDFSQHAAEPVTDGEKWLINLWTHGKFGIVLHELFCCIAAFELYCHSHDLWH